MKREYELEEAILKAINSTTEGEEVAVRFGTINEVVELVFEFPCGWTVKRNVLSGEPFGLIRGKGEIPKITVNINPYGGHSAVNK